MALIPAWIRRRWRRVFADVRFLYHDKVVRKSSKGLRRTLTLIVILAVTGTIWSDLQQPEERRYVKTDLLTNVALRERLSGRGGPRDPRVWHGWNGVNTIFALYVQCLCNFVGIGYMLTLLPVETPTQIHTSIPVAHNLTKTILSVTQHGLVVLPHMVQITSVILLAPSAITSSVPTISQTGTRPSSLMSLVWI